MLGVEQFVYICMLSLNYRLTRLEYSEKYTKILQEKAPFAWRMKLHLESYNKLKFLEVIYSAYIQNSR